VSVRKREPCNNRLNRGCRRVPAGTCTDRHRTFPEGWGVNRNKPYRRARTREIVKRRRRASTPPRSVRARRRPSQFARSPRHARRPNTFHHRAHASRQRRATVPPQPIPRWACTADRPRGRSALVRSPRNSLLLFPKPYRKHSVPLELATSEFVGNSAQMHVSVDV
jgi:hypothetical protein